MVHNGIEYGLMQIISETYDYMKRVLEMDDDEISETFAEWNEGELNSFLIEITATVLRKKDADTDEPLVEMILDTAGQKGTGKWTSQAAMDFGVPVPDDRFGRFDEADLVAKSSSRQHFKKIQCRSYGPSYDPQPDRSGKRPALRFPYHLFAGNVPARTGVRRKSVWS